jgi:serine protease Do
VTNGAARIPALIDPAITTLIQHSAQVDPGNSGGPLLIADKSAPAGYRVVGVNTWKAYNRQAANFSIPAAATVSFISEVLAGEGDSSTWRKALESRCRGFIGAAGKPENAYKEMGKYISYAYVEREGEAILKEAFSAAPAEVRRVIVDAFSNESPIDGIRLAIAYDIESRIKDAGSAGSLEFTAIKGEVASSAPVSVDFSLSGKSATLAWVREQGVWKLQDFPLDTVGAPGRAKSESKGRTGSHNASFDESPYTALFQFGPDIPLSNSLSTPTWLFNCLVVPGTYAAYGFSMGGRSIPFNSPNAGDGRSIQVQVCGLVRGQLPIRTSGLDIVPYAGLAGGLGLDMTGLDADYREGTGFLGALEGGLNFGLESLQSFYLGCAYKYYLAAPSDFKGSALSIRLGLGVGQ